MPRRVYVIPAGSNPEDYMGAATDAGCDGGLLVGPGDDVLAVLDAAGLTPPCAADLPDPPQPDPVPPAPVVELDVADLIERAGKATTVAATKGVLLDLLKRLAAPPTS